MKRILIACLLLVTSFASAQFGALRTLTPEQGQDIRRPMEAILFDATASEHAELEKKLLDMYLEPATTLEGKKFTCRLLKYCASDTAVTVLAPDLTDPELSAYVRIVFQGLKSSRAVRALTAVLPGVSSDLKIGIMGTLGQCGSTSSVKVIAPYLHDESNSVQFAAITALGNIGGKKAVKALSRATVKTQFTRVWKLAQIQASEGNISGFLGLFPAYSANRVNSQFLTDEDQQVRCAALVGLTKDNAEQAAPHVLQALASGDECMKNTARGLLKELPSNQLLEKLKNADPAEQLLLISTLSGRGEANAESVFLELTKSENEDMANAAFRGLGHLGGPASIKPLLSAAIGNPAAYDSLCMLRVSGTDEAVIKLIENTDNESVKVIMLECLARRQATSALPVFVDLAKTKWSKTSKTAIEGMATLVSNNEFDLYAELILSAEEKKKIDALERSIIVASQRLPDSDACAQSMIEAFALAKGDGRYAIIRALGGIGGNTARKQLTDALLSSDPKIKDAAIRGLANWPNLDAADQLYDIAVSAEEETQRVIALRGYIRLAYTVTDEEENLAMCKKALAATNRPAELKNIIGCAKQKRNPEVLEFLSAQLDNPEVYTEAAWAICEMSGHWKIKELSLPILERIANTPGDEILIKEAKNRIQQNSI